MDKTKRVTIYDVAYEAKVSLATVSRVLNGSDKVSKEKTKAVNNAIFKLGFVPSNVARGLAKSSSTNVAIVIPAPNYNYISSMMNGMLDVCKENGYNSLLFTFEDPDDAAKVVTNVLSSQAEGVVVFNSELNAADLHRILKLKLPMVLIGHDSYGENAMVDMNYSTELYKAIVERAKKGLNKIVYLKDPRKDWHMSNTFEKSIKSALEGFEGIDFEVLKLADSYKVTYEYFVNKFKENKPEHELYVVLRDSLGFGILNAARDCGYNFPDDLEMMAIIGTKQSIVCRPTISSIETDLYGIGKTSMQMLTDMLNGKLEIKKIIYNTKFIKRETTK